jgi:cytochrome c
MKSLAGLKLLAQAQAQPQSLDHSHMKIIVLFLALTLSFTTFAADDIQAGQKIFTSRCGWCHSVGPSARAGFAPQLNGVIGRPAGTTTDYAYSPAMKNSGLVWSEKNLIAFIQDPSKLVPGTKMRFWGMSDKQNIADLLAYLKQFH